MIAKSIKVMKDEKWKHIAYVDEKDVIQVLDKSSCLFVNIRLGTNIVCMFLKIQAEQRDSRLDPTKISYDIMAD
jgi:hypothetical protein